MRKLGYNLPKEKPVKGRKTLLWIFAAARHPEVDQRVVFCGPRGNYLTGTYRRDGWEADPDELHPEPRRVDYQPSIWRPA